jgi:hypothetical protein
MKLLLYLSCFLVVTATVIMSQAARQPAADEAARTAALKLYQSLSAEQKKLAVLPLDDKERYKEEFPAVTRAGLPFDQLTNDQKTMVEDVVKAMTSDYGATRCLTIAKETPANRRYLSFYGEPAANKAFAWRIAQHHLTLIYAEFGTDKANEFGPILLGGNPANKMWEEEEAIALELWAKLSPEEQKQIKEGKSSSTSGAAVGKAGTKIADLGEKPRALAAKLLQKRLDVFSADRRKVIDELIKKAGGAEELRIVFWGEPSKSFRDGGKYHWRIGNDTIVCDWQTVDNNHLHLTLRAKGK